MYRMISRFIGVSLVVFATAVTVSAQAGPAQDFVQNKHSSLITELKKPASAARNKRVDVMMSGLFDFHKLTKDALGKNAEGLKEEQVKKLQELVQELVTKNYKKHIEKTKNYEVTFLGDAAVPNGTGRVVRTKVSKRGSKDAPIEVNYWLYEKGGTWMVYDIETEGSSMLRNYRNQFGKIIRKDGFDALIGKLQERVKDT